MERRRTELATFAVAIFTVILIAAAVTMEKVIFQTASNDAPPYTTGLARPHQPLDRAPGEPLPAVGGPAGAVSEHR
ncbi:hypothetical protein XI06_05055 [Bradyrhizobium sp. CCBAU 11434]|nr:hypothetical protein [Bradyrhizobium sp. CCBAU 11434]